HERKTIRLNLLKSQSLDLQSTISVSTPAAARCGNISRSLSAPCGRPLQVINASRFLIDEEQSGERSYSLQVGYGALILHVAGVERAGRLKQNECVSSSV